MSTPLKGVAQSEEIIIEIRPDRMGSVITLNEVSLNGKVRWYRSY